jgi:hypothetical protein
MKRKLSANIDQHPDGFVAILTQGVFFEFTCDVDIDTCVTRLIEYSERHPLGFGDRKKRSNLILNPIGKNGYEFSLYLFPVRNRTSVTIEGTIIVQDPGSTTITGQLQALNSNWIVGMVFTILIAGFALTFWPVSVIVLVFFIAILTQTTTDCRYAPRAFYEYLTDDDRSKYMTLVEKLFGR